MAQYIHYHFKKKESRYSEEILDQGKTRPSRENCKSCSFMLISKYLVVSLSLLIQLSQADIPMVLASSTPWGLQCNPGFTFSFMQWPLLVSMLLPSLPKYHNDYPAVHLP